MTAKQATPSVVILLLVLGAAGVTVRTDFRHRTAGDRTWQLTYDVKLHASKAGATLRASFPENTRYCRVFGHSLVEKGLTTRRRRLKQPSRDIVLTAPKAGPCEFKAHFNFRVSEQPEERPDRQVILTPQLQAKYLSDEKAIQVANRTVAETAARLSEGKPSPEELLARLCDHCADMVPSNDGPNDAAAALATGVATQQGRARALVALCRVNKIPARLVTGFEITSGQNIQPHVWVGVFSGSRWAPYDPTYRIKGTYSDRFFAVRRGGTEVVRAGPDITDLEVTYSMDRIAVPAGAASLSHSNPLQILDLNRLPESMHEPLEVILLLPVGALVTAFFRTIIGLRTFGTFSPTLLALAFVYNRWQTGLVVFVSVLVLGLMSRTLLDRLKLLMVPRLGIMLTLVVLTMVFGIAVLHYITLTPSGETVLLPMVILTMLVERFYVTSEEDSIRFSLQLLAGTLFLGFIVYLLLCWKTVGEMLLVYPELHCFTIAVFVLMGRYTGYRWSELWRFRDMAKK